MPVKAIRPQCSKSEGLKIFSISSQCGYGWVHQGLLGHHRFCVEGVAAAHCNSTVLAGAPALVTPSTPGTRVHSEKTSNSNRYPVDSRNVLLTNINDPSGLNWQEPGSQSLSQRQQHLLCQHGDMYCYCCHCRSYYHLHLLLFLLKPPFLHVSTATDCTVTPVRSRRAFLMMILLQSLMYSSLVSITSRTYRPYY